MLKKRIVSFLVACAAAISSISFALATEPSSEDGKTDDTANPIEYGIEVPEASGGDTLLSDNTVEEGKRVSIIAVPQPGYELTELSVKGLEAGDGNVGVKYSGGNEYIFTMPAYDVSILPVYEKAREKHDIVVTETEGGSLNVSPNPAAKGETVTIPSESAPAYKLNSIAASSKVGKDIQMNEVSSGTYSFEMSDFDVFVTPVFEPIYNAHKIDTVQHENGTVVSTAKNARKGETITVSVIPTKGYESAGISINDEEGNAVAFSKVSGNDFLYTFEMVDSDVTITPSFKAVPAVSLSTQENGSVTNANTTQTKPVTSAKPTATTKPTAANNNTNSQSQNTSSGTSNAPAKNIASTNTQTAKTPSQAVSKPSNPVVSVVDETKSPDTTASSAKPTDVKPDEADVPDVKIISVFVPIDLPIRISSDGKIVLPEKAYMKSNVIKGDICVKDISVKLASGLKPAAANSKDGVNLSMRDNSLNPQGEIQLTQKNWIVKPTQSLSLNIKADMPDNAKPITDKSIAKIEFVLDWTD